MNPYYHYGGVVNIIRQCGGKGRLSWDNRWCAKHTVCQRVRGYAPLKNNVSQEVVKPTMRKFRGTEQAVLACNIGGSGGPLQEKVWILDSDANSGSKNISCVLSWFIIKSIARLYHRERITQFWTSPSEEDEWYVINLYTVLYTTSPYISLMWEDMWSRVIYRTVLCYHSYLVSCFLLICYP